MKFYWHWQITSHYQKCFGNVKGNSISRIIFVMWKEYLYTCHLIKTTDEYFCFLDIQENSKYLRNAILFVQFDEECANQTSLWGYEFERNILLETYSCLQYALTVLKRQSPSSLLLSNKFSFNSQAYCYTLLNCMQLERIFLKSFIFNRRQMDSD